MAQLQQKLVVAAIAVLGLAVVASGDSSSCTLDISPFFGMRWQAAFDLYNTEGAWKKHGALTKIDMYYEKQSGCMMGLRTTYGVEGASKLLGADQVPGVPLYNAELPLESGEGINQVELNVGSCISYISLRTTTGKVLAVGDRDTDGTLQTSTPAESGGTLAYIRAYTDKLNTGSLQRLQLVWSSGDCSTLAAKQAAHLADTEEQLNLESAAQAPTAGAPNMVSTDDLVEYTVVEVPEDPNTVGLIPTGGASSTKAEVTANAAAGGAASTDGVKVTEIKEDTTAAAAAAAAAAAPEVTIVSEDDVRAAAAAAAATPDNTAGDTSVTVTYPDAEPTSASTTTTTTTSVTYTTGTTNGTNGSCKGGVTCQDGMCATSSCALNGMGKDVVPMMCFGTNLMPNPLLDAAGGNPCTNLACKLDRPNCTSIGLLGLVGGFCTGRVVAMGQTAKLHTTGKAFLGYPCIEHKGAVLDLLPVGDYSAKGMFISKAWKVCDCIQGPEINPASLTARPFTGPRFPTLPKFPFFNKPLVNMSLADVLAQWVIANQAEAQLPEITLGPTQARHLKLVLPDITFPSLVVPRISAPLMRLPADVSLPVFTIPGNDSLQHVVHLLPNISSLPTIMVPAQTTEHVPQLMLPEVTIPNLNDLAGTFGVPTVPKFPGLSSLTFKDAVTQWMAANEINMPLPRVHLTENTIKAVQAVIDNFVVPSLVVTNISLPLLRLPSPFPMPVISVAGDDLLQKVSKLLPRLTSLPTLMVPLAVRVGSPKKLPQLLMPNVTIPDFEQVAAAVGAALPKFPKLPQILSSLNISIPAVDLSSIPSSINLELVDLPKLNFTMPNLPEKPVININLPDLPAAPQLPQMPQVPQIPQVKPQMPKMPQLPKLPQVPLRQQQQQQPNAPNLDLSGLAELVGAVVDNIELPKTIKTPDGNTINLDPFIQTLQVLHNTAEAAQAGGITINLPSIPSRSKPAAAAESHSIGPAAGDAAVTEVPQAAGSTSDDATFHIASAADANVASASTAYLEPSTFYALDKGTRDALLETVNDIKIRKKV